MDATDHPHDWQIPSTLDAQRRAWRRSFLLALSIHLAIGAWLLSYVVPPPPTDDVMRVEPMLRAAITEEVAKPLPTFDAANAAEPPAAVASAEPSLGDIRGGVERAITSAAQSVDSQDAIKRLADQARILEQVSNPQEVARMSEKISEAMGLHAWPQGATSRPVAIAAFDFNKAMLLDITREERGDTLTIRQVMGTRDGARAIIESSRRVTEKGPRFEQRLIEASRADAKDPPVIQMDADEFAAVEAQQKPYELIRQYPLVQQLHHAAVLPLMEKLVEEYGDTGVPPP